MTLAMQGASRESLTAARERLDATLDDTAAAHDGLRVAGELFGVVDLLDGQPALRGALTDPARDGEDKRVLLTSLLSGKVDAVTLDLLGDMVQSRWSSTGDLADAVDALAIQAVATTAAHQGHIDDLEDDVFRCGQIVSADPALRAALNDRSAPAAAKSRLVSDLLADKVTPASALLLERVLSHPRGRSLEDAIASAITQVAERRRQVTVTVVSAVALSPEQRDRLRTALSHQLMTTAEVQLNVVVDPAVVGGLKITMGDEVIDATIASRLEEARRRLAG